MVPADVAQRASVRREARRRRRRSAAKVGVLVDVDDVRPDERCRKPRVQTLDAAHVVLTWNPDAASASEQTTMAPAKPPQLHPGRERQCAAAAKQVFLEQRLDVVRVDDDVRAAGERRRERVGPMREDDEVWCRLIDERRQAPVEIVRGAVVFDRKLARMKQLLEPAHSGMRGSRILAVVDVHPAFDAGHGRGFRIAADRKHVHGADPRESTNHQPDTQRGSAARGVWRMARDDDGGHGREPPIERSAPGRRGTSRRATAPRKRCHV